MKTLRWSEQTKTWLMRRIFDNGNDVKNGVSCVFVPLTKKVGAKLYFDVNNRNFSHRNQTHAQSYGIGPRTGDRFEMNFLCMSQQSDYRYVRDAVKSKVYGYLTEIAEPVERVSRSEKKIICEKLKSIGLQTYDLGTRNLGKINGKLIVIDFDMATHS